MWLVPTVEKFPRSQKFLLGDRIQRLPQGEIEISMGPGRRAPWTARAAALALANGSGTRGGDGNPEGAVRSGVVWKQRGHVWTAPCLQGFFLVSA